MDVNGARELSDAVSILGYLFQGTAEPLCLDSADTDDNGHVDLGDAVFLLGSLFLGLGELPPPSHGPAFTEAGLSKPYASAFSMTSPPFTVGRSSLPWWSQVSSR